VSCGLHLHCGVLPSEKREHPPQQRRVRLYEMAGNMEIQSKEDLQQAEMEMRSGAQRVEFFFGCISADTSVCLRNRGGAVDSSRSRDTVHCSGLTSKDCR